MSPIRHLSLRTATAIFRHPLKTAALVLALLAAAFALVPQLKADGRIEAFMHEADPALATYYEMRRDFGQDNRIIVTVQSPEIFSRDFLTKFSQFHNEIGKEVPYIAELFSLYNIPFIEYDGGGIYLEELVHNMLVREQDPRQLRDRVVSTPLYRNFIISADGKTAAIVVEPYRFAPHPTDCIARPDQAIACEPAEGQPAERQLLGPAQYAEMTRAIQAVAERYREAGQFDIHIAGAPVVSTEIVKLMSKDMPRFTLLCVGIALLTILVVYRSLLVSVGALFAFASSIVMVFALMVLAGVALTPPTQLMIPLLLVNSLLTFIHFVSAQLHGYKATGDKTRAIGFAMERCHVPILFSALTTAAGMIGFSASALAPITQLGIFGGLGILISYAMAMISAILVFRVLGQRFFTRRYEEYPAVTAWMTRVSLFAMRNPVRVLLAAVVVAGLSLTGIQSLQYSHNSLLWLPEDNQVRQSTLAIDDTFRGSVNLEVVVTPRPGIDFRNEELMRRVDAVADRVHGMAPIPIGRHTSIIDFIKETNQALHQGDRQAHAVPTQEEIWDELLLLEGQGSDDMQRYVTTSYDAGRVSFLTPWLEAKEYNGFIQLIQSQFETELRGLADVRTTGLIAILAETSTAVLDSVTSSYLLSLALITLLMCISLGKLRLGLLSMLPNIVPFLVLLGVMGAFGIPIDTFTVLIGSIITGLIVDDTTHYFFQYKRNLERFGAVEPAIRGTIQDVGVPMFTATVVVIASFAVFTVSSLSNIQSFGLLMALGAGLAVFADLLVSPALLALIGHGRRRTSAEAFGPDGLDLAGQPLPTGGSHAS